MTFGMTSVLANKCISDTPLESLLHKLTHTGHRLQIPSANKLCDPGAVAFDAEDGNLTAKVLSCPPASCLDRGCPGHEFALKGLSGCLNVSAPVGTTFNISFLVLDSAQPPNINTTSRLVTIVDPCEADEFW